MKFRILLSAPGVLESVLFVVVATLLNTDPRPFFVGKTTTERLCWKELWLSKGRQKVNGMLTQSFLENLQPPIYKLSVSSKSPAWSTWIFFFSSFWLIQKSKKTNSSQIHGNTFSLEKSIWGIFAYGWLGCFADGHLFTVSRPNSWCFGSWNQFLQSEVKGHKLRSNGLTGVSW